MKRRLSDQYDGIISMTSHSLPGKESNTNTANNHSHVTLSSIMINNRDSIYYIENGLKKVYPYYFEYQTFAKSRWIGMTISQVFKKEFRDRPPSYYDMAIENGLIKVNDVICTKDYKVKFNDSITHKIHRHEPPILSYPPIQIIDWSRGKESNDNDFLVINKPPSIPCHPSGRYNHNSLTEILRHQYNFDHISIVNRLDRLTSGLVMIALNQDKAEKMHHQMSQRQFNKEYVCRVRGVFPLSDSEDQMITCTEPLKIVAHKVGLVAVHRSGKESITKFKRISTNGIESIVVAKPITGRTHQIRVHLQYLGHSIVNDTLYGGGVTLDIDNGNNSIRYKDNNDNHDNHDNDCWKGYKGGRYLQDHELDSIALALHNRTIKEEEKQQQQQQQQQVEQEKIEYNNDASFDNNNSNNSNNDKTKEKEKEKEKKESTISIDNSCPDCHIRRTDPDPREMLIYLHAYKYSSDEWSFECPWPEWTRL